MSSRSSAVSPQAVKCHSTTKVADACPGRKKCPCCQCGKRMFCRTKYIQPERTKSFKPNQGYLQPESSMAGDTVYKLSYPGVAPGERVTPFVHHANLTSGGDVSGDTVYKMSYPGWHGIVRPEPIFPDRRNLLGDGPMQDETTQRHDYQPQPMSRPELIKPFSSIVPSNKPFDDLTTMVASYLPLNPQQMAHSRPKPFAPQRTYTKSGHPLDGKTVHKMSYLPWKTPVRPDMPWAKKDPYQPPCQPMDVKTVYKTSYLPSKDIGRRQPIKHAGAGDPLSDSRYFDDGTVYRHSYLPVADSHKFRPEPFKASHNIYTSQARMDANTIHKMSYPGWRGIVRPEPIFPLDRKLLGDGPMQDETTQRHDYQPQPMSRPEIFKPPLNLVVSNRPLDDLTTMIASYQPPGQGAFSRVKSFAPERYYQPSSTPMDDKTVHKMSFVAQPVRAKEDLPWARRPAYQPPCQSMDVCTVYKASYVPPGGSVQVCEPYICSPCDCCRRPFDPPRNAPEQICLG